MLSALFPDELIKPAVYGALIGGVVGFFIQLATTLLALWIYFG